MEPIISVIMPTFNAETYLRESVESILNQSIDDFELLIVDDGSTDGTLNLLNSYKDKRIKILNGPRNGIAAALNLGIHSAAAKFIARMDADDVSLPDRFENQIKILNESGAGFCAGNVELTGVTWPFWGRNCLTPQDFYTRLLWEMPLCHPSVMWRNDIFKSKHLFYDENFKDTEDFEFFSRAVRYVDFVATEAVVLKYRMHKNQATNKAKDKGKMNYLKIIRRNFYERLNVTINEDDLEMFWPGFTPESEPYYRLSKYFFPTKKDKKYNQKIIKKFLINTHNEFYNKNSSHSIAEKINNLMIKVI
ncbi:MAG: glycosyltransferase [Mesosutterella sp.]|nr:glycosyltransferase [Mesosutterella sp.]